MDGVEYDELKMCVEDLWKELVIMAADCGHYGQDVIESLEDSFPFLKFIGPNNEIHS